MHTSDYYVSFSFCSAWSVAVDKNDTIFVATYYGSILQWKKNESDEGKVVVDQLGEPRGISIDSFGTLYIADCGDNSIVRVVAGSKNATVIAAGNGIGDAPNQLYNPADVAFDSYGNLYVSDYGNGRVQRFKINLKTPTNSFQSSYSCFLPLFSAAIIFSFLNRNN